MPEPDDFIKTDNTFSNEGVSSNLLPTISNKNPLTTKGTKGTLAYRQNLLKDYHNGQNSLTDRLKIEGKNGIEHLVLALVEEIIKETDNLLGNQLLATQNGDIRDATIISDKRASVLAQAIKAIQSKQEFEKERGGFDLDSPSMRVVFEYFMTRVRESFKELNYNSEQTDIFYRALGSSMLNWQKDLKIQLSEINSIGNKNVKKY